MCQQTGHQADVSNPDDDSDVDELSPSQTQQSTLDHQDDGVDDSFEVPQPGEDQDASQPFSSGDSDNSRALVLYRAPDPVFHHLHFNPFLEATFVSRRGNMPNVLNQAASPHPAPARSNGEELVTILTAEPPWLTRLMERLNELQERTRPVNLLTGPTLFNLNPQISPERLVDFTRIPAMTFSTVPTSRHTPPNFFPSALNAEPTGVAQVLDELIRPACIPCITAEIVDRCAYMRNSDICVRCEEAGLSADECQLGR